MIEGKSGTGKTSLALGLLDAARLRNIEASFVCDDQAMLCTKDGHLWATTPPALAGKVELYGAGITTIEFIPQCEIHLVCELVDQSQISRMPEPEKCQRLGIVLNLIYAPRQHETMATRIVLDKLSLPL